ncbi:shikimate kinase [Mucilaginibacter sp. AW1-3]
MSTNVSQDHIYLIGFMGCGKTTWSKKLAARLGYEFIDLDTVLEEQVGKSIGEYFAEHGEVEFRNKESEVLKKYPYPDKAVISTGGGLPCFFDNMDWMNSHGQTLYIKLSPKTLGDRLENARVVRPVLQGKKGDELVAFIEGKLAERESFYNQATHVLDGLTLNVDDMATLVAKS